MSVLAAFQKGIKAQIDAAALGVSVYDGAPSSAAFPYIEFGPDSSFSDDADCIAGREVTLQIDIWGEDHAKMHPTRTLVDQVYSALHEADLTLDEPYAPVTCRVSLTRTMMDPDGIRAHGVLQVTGLIEDRT